MRGGCQGKLSGRNWEKCKEKWRVKVFNLQKCQDFQTLYNIQATPGLCMYRFGFCDLSTVKKFFRIWTFVTLTHCRWSQKYLVLVKNRFCHLTSFCGSTDVQRSKSDMSVVNEGRGQTSRDDQQRRVFLEFNELSCQLSFYLGNF